MGDVRIACILSLVLFASCDDPWVAERQSAPTGSRTSSTTQDEIGPFPKLGLFTISTSGQTGPAGTADDPTIWIHPTDPSLSLVIGSNKGTSGGLHVFDLQGVQRQFMAGGRYNNVDLRYGFPLQGGAIDLVAVSDRTRNQIDLYAIDSVTGLLRPVGSIQTSIVVYGFAMYHDRSTRRYYGFVSSETRVEQWEFIGRTDGTVGGVLVRAFTTTSMIEGIVVDDELGDLYMAEEATGIYKYDADPSSPTTRLATVDLAGSTTQLMADIEGLTLYYRRDGLGYLIASSQGNDRYIVYRREGNNAYLGTFALASVSNTDGIDVNHMMLGSAYPQGMFVAQNNDLHFRMARWQDIATALGLAIDTSGYELRPGADCAAAQSVALSGVTATIDVGATAQWQATATDGAGNSLFGCAVTWATSDPAVATVSATGLVLGVAAGSAVLSATIEGASAAVTVTVVTPVNHAPVVSVTSIPSVTEGTNVTVAATFTDDAVDTHTATIGWGDGATGAGTLNPTTRTVTGSHVFVSDGVYTITVTVSDNHGVAGEGMASLTVTDRPPLNCYVAFGSGATAAGLTFANEDILAFDGSSLSMHFDGSDVGLGSFTLDAFQIIGPSLILLSFTNSGTVGGVPMDDSDILRFTATSLGTVTAGTFDMYFDASDVGLESSDEDVDAVELLPDGRLLLSTLGSFSVIGATGADEDLVAFQPTALGNTTTGTFALYFDGSDVGLTSSNEDVDAVAVDGAGRILLSTTGAFAVTGAAGADEDVFQFTPTSTGSVTSGTYSPALVFDGSLVGLAANDLVGIDRP